MLGIMQRLIINYKNTDGNVFMVPNHGYSITALVSNCDNVENAVFIPDLKLELRSIPKKIANQLKLYVLFYVAVSYVSSSSDHDVNH